MTYIDEMVKDLCPNGVEWKELGEVCEFNRGQSLTSKKAIYGEVPVISGGKKPAFMHNISNRGAGTVVIAGSGAYAGFVSYWDKPIFVSDAFSVDVKNEKLLLTRYLYHFLLNIQNKIYTMKTGAGIPYVYGKNISKFKIPIPPLEIQKEIVKTLDKFIKYVTELTAELTFRKQQYSYYRDKLLSFEDEVYQVEWKTLGEILVKGRGTKITASQMQELHKENAPIRIFAGGKTFADVDYGDIPKKDIHNEEAIIVKSRGIIDFEYYTKPFSFKNEFWSYSSDNEDVNLRYIYHYLNHNKAYFQHIASNMQMPQISSNATEKYKIPVPPLYIQERIVQVLDNFDMVCNDLNIGLPKEIELRQKQYEYFRDRLLTFTAEGVYTDSTVQYSNWVIVLLQWVFGPIRVSLGSICHFTRGNGLQKKDFVDKGYPVIHYGQIYTRYGFSTTETLSFADKAVFDKLKKAKPNDIVMATTSENVADVGKAVVWEGNEEIGVSGDAYIVHTSQNARYINYFLQSIHFQMQKERKVTGTKVIRINAKDMNTFIINLPSLSNQTRIASILDMFDTLTNDLTKGLPREIELRQKQYEYWRNKLLRF